MRRGFLVFMTCSWKLESTYFYRASNKEHGSDMPLNDAESIIENDADATTRGKLRHENFLEVYNRNTNSRKVAGLKFINLGR